MTAPSSASALDAAVRALRGESDLAVVMPALANAGLARIIACAPDADHVVRAIAALCGGLPSLLDPQTRADPALHAAMARLIGTPAGRAALHAWAAVAPAGWGRTSADALIGAVQQRSCTHGAAAALIGPDDRSAALLGSSEDIAFAIRSWGLANPAAPTAWTDALAPAERDRLITTVQRDSFQVASCLPWLPLNVANRMRIKDDDLGAALNAYAAAPPTARATHAEIVQQLGARARPTHLAALTRLACATGSDAVWRRVQALLHEAPFAARHVVAAAPWDDLADDVRDVILAYADTSDVCAAVAAAQGKRTSAPVSWSTAVAFFAVLDPRVWDALDAAARQRWLQALPHGDAHLAVRSLGLRAEVLARAAIGNDLVLAVHRHARGEGAWRAALLPITLRNLPLAAAHAGIGAMPMPPDPGAFFCIAGGRDDPDLIAPACAALRSPADLALAVVLQRSGEGGASIRASCAALQHALRGRSDDDLAPLRALLSDAAHAALMPDREALIARLAHPDQRDALRQALARLASLPLDVAIPTCVALTRWTPWNASDTADALAHALRAHGGVVLALADALADERLRAALLPLPEDVALADALRGLAQDDPVTARRLAQALRDRSWRDALHALLHAPPRVADAVWQAFDDDARHAIGAMVDLSPSDGDPPVIRDPIVALALAALQSSDDDLRDAGVTALTARPEMTRTIWGQLPLEMQQTLGALPAFADLPLQARPVIRRGILRGRA